MDRSRLLSEGMQLTGTTQSELSRLTGVPQGRISQYVNGRLEPSEPTLSRLLSAMGVTTRITVAPVEMERTKRRSWQLHRAISVALGKHLPGNLWQRMQHNLDRVREHSRGEPHERNMTRWQHIIDEEDLRELRRTLTDSSPDGIDMREVSPMAGLLPEEDRLRILAEVPR